MNSQHAAASAAGPATDADGGPVLRLNEVVRTFGGVVAVDRVSLSVARGERLGVIGPNGAGKTTLFRVIAGEMRASAGTVHLFGKDVTRMPAHRRARLGVSRTFQVSNLFSELSVLDNVRIAAQASSSSRWRFWRPTRATEDSAQEARATLEQVGLGRRRDDRVADLSHGEKRQLEIAMALVTNPALLLLDEPAAGLSLGERAQLRRLLENLPDELSILLIEHDMSLALDLSDKVLCLDNGRPISFGNPADVRDDQLVQAVYLGRARSDADPA